MSYDPASRDVVLFGGLDNKVDSNQTWEFQAGNWTQLTPATSPSARGLASMAYDAHDGVVILFGGTDIAGRIFGDTWTFSAEVWMKVSRSVHPSARFGAAFGETNSTRGGKLVLFGGVTAAGASNQTWICYGGRWTLDNTSVSPIARDYATFVPDVLLGKLHQGVLFGGAGA